MVRKKDKTLENKKEQDAPVETEKKFARFVEEVKITNDYLKHVATLDTGSILIMATFLQKSANAGLEKLVWASAFFFIMSIVGVIVSQGLLVGHVSDTVEAVDKLPTEDEKRLYRTAIGIAYISFAIGITILAAFMMFNL